VRATGFRHRRLNAYHATGCKEKIEGNEKPSPFGLGLLIEKWAGMQAKSVSRRKIDAQRYRQR
jgi:hypothetical protein